MKKIKLFSLLLALATLTFTFSSCSDDEPTIPVEEGLAIADGFYMTISDTDPVSTGQLKSEVVEDVSFGTQEREGYLAGYVFLAAGDYQLVEVASKKIVSTLGGVASTRNTDTDDVAGTNDGLSGCGYNDYTLVAATVDGDAFNVASAGIYKVTYDKTLSEIVLFKIEKAQLIGAATPIGWDTKSDMATLAIDGTATADSVSFKISGVVLRPGEFKIRFGCRWKIDRRVDKTLPTDTHAASNGYVIQTNFGGELSGGKIIKLAPGGENVVIPAGGDGEYEVVAKWTPADGFSISVTKTGDAPELTFDPNDYKWGIIGDATAGAWDTDRDMYYKGEDGGTHTWYTVVTFGATGEFKFRANDAWEVALGGTLTTSESDLSLGGGNIATPGAGDYYIVLQTADEGSSWTAPMSEAGWGIIGDGSPQGNWDADIDMTAAFADGITTYTITGDFTTDGWKFRAGDAWDYSLGGDMTALEAGGGNLSLAEAGNYTVVLSYDGSVYSAVATKN